MSYRKSENELDGITRQFTVWCSYCENWEQIDAEIPRLRNVPRIFRKMGWKHDQDGWKCPKCLAERP